ncbi:MAG: hypothetical protein RL071_754 [Pseudomonadota bacterium]|jgi:hypothetical protein
MPLRHTAPRALLALVATAALLPARADAKDLRKRFGLGFNSYLDESAGLAARYVVPSGDEALNIVVEGNVGFSTISLSERFAAGGRLLTSVVAEDNMNFYVGGGLGYVSGDAGDALRIQPLASVDFFMFGLENLGFTSSFGVNIDVGGGRGGLSTASQASAGLTYWF